MTQNLLDNILAKTYTQTEALSRLHALKNLLVVELFGHKDSHPSAVHAQETSWLVSLGKDFYKHFNKNNVYKIFDSLESEIKQIKPLVVFLPFELPEEGITVLGQRLRKLFGKRFLAEIKIDPTLLGGAAFVWNGVYKDYSIRKKIEDNKERIIKMLKEEIIRK